VSLADLPDPNSSLVVGSVTTTMGTVIMGNGSGDAAVGVDIGTLDSGGGSAAIAFDVLVNEPFPPGILTIANQGQVSGSNFAPVMTDDPSTVAAHDATLTQVANTQLDICERDLGQCGSDLFTCEAAKSEITADLVIANAALGQTGALLNQCTVNESQCQTALSGAQTSLTQCTATRDQCQASLSQSQSLLVQCSADLFQAGGTLAACNTNLTQAGVALTESAAALDQCSSSLQESVANLASTTAELGTTEAALASMTQERDAAEVKISEQDAKIRSLQARLDTCEGHPPNLACQADLSGDGMVNFKDLGLFKSVFFKKCEPTP